MNKATTVVITATKKEFWIALAKSKLLLNKLAILVNNSPPKPIFPAMISCDVEVIPVIINKNGKMEIKASTVSRTYLRAVKILSLVVIVSTYFQLNDAQNDDRDYNDKRYSGCVTEVWRIFKG